MECVQNHTDKQHVIKTLTGSRYPSCVTWFLFNRLATCSSLKIADRCFRITSRRLWDQLAVSLGQPLEIQSISLLSLLKPVSSSSSLSRPLSSSLTRSVLHCFIQHWNLPVPQILLTADFSSPTRCDLTAIWFGSVVFIILAVYIRPRVKPLMCLVGPRASLAAHYILPVFFLSSNAMLSGHRTLSHVRNWPING